MIENSPHLALKSPAKINLFLKVTGKREDGYHDLVTLMCAVGLFDTVTLTFKTPCITVRCTHPAVPDDERNIAFRAADLFFNHLGVREGVDIIIQKNIPVAAGLGGGSSNAAAVLIGLNRFYGNALKPENLLRMGRTLGADVPFFIAGEPAIARGVGDQLTPYRKLPPFHVLLVNPGVSVSTAAVYQALNFGLTKPAIEIRYLEFENQDFDPEKHLVNDLERVTEVKYPVITQIKANLLEQGAKGVLMSGSGPTVFGLFSDANTARLASGSLSQHGQWHHFIADLLI